MTELPVQQIIPQLQQGLISNANVILTSPPGSGKSTYLPLQLLSQPWLDSKRIILLEPRRLAARNVAWWLAQQLGEQPGQTVGYRMRGDTQVSQATKIEVVTEGILGRILQNNPELEEYGLVIFDEFHERNLQSDLALTLCLDLQENLRDDLRLLIMSATLDVKALTDFLPDAPLIQSSGKSYPVDIRYSKQTILLRDYNATAQVVIQALQTLEGDVLVFLPGAGEIQRLIETLLPLLDNKTIDVYPLFGGLSQSQQEQAIKPSIVGRRKVVLATNIAETSLTIEGIHIVIDGGYQRVARYHTSSGMNRLETVRISQANAEQRCGRAGRLGPGYCFRLWTEDAQRSLLPVNDPEILDTDLTAAVLELAQWGVRDVSQLRWLTPPPVSNFRQAQQLLQQLGALNENNLITPHGKNILELGVHPRLAHMILQAKSLRQTSLACDIAALLSERDILNKDASVDLQLRLEVLQKTSGGTGMGANKAVVQRVKMESIRWQRQLEVKQEEIDIDNAGILLAMAYPDRIAKKRQGSATHYRLSNGKGAVIAIDDPLHAADYLVVPNLDGQQQNARIFLAAAISEKELIDAFEKNIETVETIYWDKKDKAVKAMEQTRLFQLVLKESSCEISNKQQILAMALQGIREEGINILPWGEDVRQLQRRVMLLHQRDETAWPDVSDDALLASLESWLAPFLSGVQRLSQITEQTLKSALTSLLDWNQQQSLDELVPTHYMVPSGSRLKIDYCEGEVPVLRVRLQELFGLGETPSILRGSVPLLLYLLSPAQRPIQMTRDLTSFWQNTYAEVKKDLKGRYPKHYWPDDPLTAQATSRAKPRKS